MVRQNEPLVTSFNVCVFFLNDRKKKLKMSDAIDDMRAYSQLTDDILLRFLWSVDSNLNDSKKIVEKIFNRDIYKCVWENEWPSVGLVVLISFI